MDFSHIRPVRHNQSMSRFECKFCHKIFVNEDNFLNHECKQMKRDKELKTIDGQTALIYYQQWMKQMKKLPPPAASFLSSRYFRTFMDFVKFAKSVRLPNPEKFIWFAVQKKFTPIMWSSNDVYTLYLEFLDHKTPPMEQANTSITTLLNYADRHNIDVSNVFDHIEPYEIISFLQTRQLSPWLLLLSKKFKQFLINRTTSEQQMIIESVIRPEYWGAKFAEHKQDIVDIKKCIEALDI